MYVCVSMYVCMYVCTAEHMLFLGTKKYPDEQSYHSFLTAHGGRANAFTAQETTNFYFEVNYGSFHDVLDRYVCIYVYE